MIAPSHTSIDLFRFNWKALPNTKGNLYYPFFSLTAYYDQILKDYLLTTIDSDSYRFNDGKLIINVASPSQIPMHSQVNYIRERMFYKYDGKTGDDHVVYTKFYHVKRWYYSAGKLFLICEPDNFANAFADNISFAGAHITRTSRGTPELRSVNSVLAYDGVAVTRGKLHYSLNYYDYSSYQSLCAIAKIDMILENDLFGNNAVTRTAFVAFDVGDIYSKFQTAYAKVGSKKYDGMTMVQDFLGSIYQATTYSGQPNALACRCSGIYIIPQGYISPLANISIDSTFDFSATLRSALTPYEGLLLGRILPACHYEEELGIVGSTTDISGVRYYGVRGQLIELPRSFLSQECIVVFDSNSCGLSLKLRAGKNETDFTSSFSLPCSFSNDIDTEEVQQINGMKSAVTGLSNVLRNLRKVSPLGAAFEVGNSLANAMLTSNTKANPIEGNAFMTYLPEQDEDETTDDYITKCHTKWASPFITAYVDDVADVNTYVRFNGAVTDQFTSDNKFLATMQARDFLGTNSYNETFLKADVIAGGCSQEELDAVVSAFADGIRYKYVTSS